MSKIGYARVSTSDQSLDVQIEKLKAAGCSKVFSDTATGSSTNREGLVNLMAYLRSGDTLVITRIDRIARSVLDLQQLIKQLQEQDIAFSALEQPVSTDSASEKAFLDMLAVFAEFELNIRRERQLEGITAAKKAGKYKGRKPLSESVATQVKQLYAERTSVSSIARTLGISRNSVYKILKSS
ncbi:recombinase family protein [Vibrio marisflavi]|uniref:DNA-invertase hin n=1 Tax=Vibrio marisflavi CECT 7928 TaxID=634439 RepID=A0ABM9A185_9VIBR|nr:recombinase family protein [Vibrio marisflavi]CAH0537477.1 DNA-invertase hin [Vibrio marisflavi CECT 7928]